MNWPIKANSFGQQVVRRPRCPVCDSTKVTCYKSAKQTEQVMVRYYRCNECRDMTTREPTCFRVTVV